MIDFIISKMHDGRFLSMLFAAIAAGATVLTLAMPLLAGDALPKRMKSVAYEREKIRQRERERLARGEKVVLRASPKQYMLQAVERFNLKKWLGQEEARAKLMQAGYRGEAPYVAYLFFRMVTPVVMMTFGAFYVFVVLELNQPTTVKLGLCIFATYLGMHLPYLFLKNRITKRQLSIRRAFPDALDLLLICVESGMSIEAAFKRGERRNRFAIGRARRRAHAHHRGAFVSAGSPAGLRQPRQAHRSRRREIGLHGAAAGRALRHAARRRRCA
jgi:tight adherence protein C